ncbi:MAG TPA: YceI family protein [Thermoanaerobaculia bacterium]|nr:YceI family protein [Thermoanaerobaculia bacterium]
MKTTLAALATIALAATTVFAAETFNIDRSHSSATFKIRHLMSNVTGNFGEFKGMIAIDREKPASSSVEFTINPASINTGAEDRDKHLRSADFFDVEKHPEITFKSTRVASSGTKDLYNVTGNFTMHGVTREITLPVQFLGFGKDPWGNERAGFEIDTALDRKDYGITWNKALDQGGFMLSDEVKININIEAVKKK